MLKIILYVLVAENKLPLPLILCVQVFKKKVDSAQAGENVGVLLRGVRQEVLARGMALCALGSQKFSNR